MNVSDASEIMLAENNESMPIMISEIKRGTTLGTIFHAIYVKNGIMEHKFSVKMLKNAQKESHRNNINQKKLDSVLFQNERNQLEEKERERETEKFG